MKETVFQWLVDKLLPLLIAGLFSVGVFVFVQGRYFGVHEEMDRTDRENIVKTQNKVDRMDERLRALELLAAQQTITNQNLVEVLKELRNRTR